MRQMLLRILYGTAVLILLLSLTAAVQAETTTTVMVYMCGSDISDDALEDVREIQNGLSGNNVTVTLLAGGAAEWSREFTPRRLNRCIVTNRGIQQLETLSNRNMGSSDTLADFLDWSISNHPASRYILILWDHGGGSGSGICWDETNGSDYLSLKEINQALSNCQKRNADFHLDLIGFDACLMGTYETAAHVSGYADFMVGSEELIPGYGFFYTDWLKELCRNPEMDSQTIGTNICDTFIQYCRQHRENNYLSLSVTYLPALPHLVSSLETFSGYLVQALHNGELGSLSRVRSRMYSFGGYYDSESGCVDFMAFLDATKQYASSTASDVQKAYESAVRYSVGTKDFDYLTGLSIFFPNNRSDLGEVEMNTQLIPNQAAFFQGYAMLRGNSGGFYGSSGGYGFSGSYDSYGSDGYVFSGSYDSYDYDDGYGYDESWYADWGYDSSYCFSIPSPIYIDCNTVQSVTFIPNPASPYLPGGGYVAEESLPAGTGTTFADVTDSLPPIASTLTEDADTQVGSLQPETIQESMPMEANNPISGYAITLSEDDMQHLSDARGILYLDGSEEDLFFVIDMGAYQNVAIDWDTGIITSLYDGTLPFLNEQMVAMFDVINTVNVRRSVIPVRFQGKDGYLCIARTKRNPDWVVIGFSEGYNENGMPMRGTRKLQEGDVVIPLYTAYYMESGEEEMSEQVVEGDPITVGKDGQLTLEFIDMTGEGEKLSYLFCFELTNLYGDHQYSELVDFEM